VFLKFEGQEIRELKMIMDGQNELSRSLKLIVNKLDEVVGRQERELSLLTLINQQNQGGIPPQAGQQVVYNVAFLNMENCLSILNA